MRAILEFELPEEEESFIVHQNAWKYKIAMDDFYNNSIRARIKYQEFSKEITEELEKIRNEWVAVTEGLDIL